MAEYNNTDRAQQEAEAQQKPDPEPSTDRSQQHYRFLAEQRGALFRIVFGTGNTAARLFDIVLIAAIVLSVLLVMIDSIVDLPASTRTLLRNAEFGFTLLFTLEYLLRIFISPKPLRYMASFLGIIDLLAILPTYLAFLYPEAGHFMVIRLLRILRIFRVLKLVRYVEESRVLTRALKSSSRKIFVFFFFVLVMATIFGSLIFLIEGPEHGFESIPHSVYWAIITITTVGYGDIVPQTALGQGLASVVTLIGYSIIAVPTGIITAELSLGIMRAETLKCSHCGSGGHQQDAQFCRVCGEKFEA